jgi:hypothetical protein
MSCLVNGVGAQVDIDIAESIEHGTNSSPDFWTQGRAVVGFYHGRLTRERSSR